LIDKLPSLERYKTVALPVVAAIILLSNLLVFPLPAFAAAPVGVLKSARNSTAYQDEHLGTFDEDYANFRQTLEAANIRFDELSDADVAAGPAKLSGYKLIIVPLLVDESPEVMSGLTDFERGGGKLLITDSGGTPQPAAQALEALAGANIVKQSTATDKRSLLWPKQPLPVREEFAVGSVSAVVNPTNDGTPLATWSDVNGISIGPAVIKRNNSIFLGWAPGMQGDITSNAALLSLALEELSPGITQQSAVQISFADYQTIHDELEYLQKRTEETIKTAKQGDFAVPFKMIQQRFDSAMENVRKFDDAYHNRRYYEADEFLHLARQDFSMAFAQAMPVRPVEARCVWLDRGTLVTTKNAHGMSQLFDKLKGAGVNVVYFETNNAGFTMYPSRMATQNPAMVGWDPLAVAIKEAHRRGMELHAWLWIFNVGNALHNRIVGKEADYPGPVLTSHSFTWALCAKDGSLLANRQHEYWLDPSNPEARAYARDLMLEVVRNYPVDGVQYDYIRYPFNGKGTEMGFNWLGRQRFEKDTGLSLDRLDDETRQIWVAWKVAQVNSFVKETSQAVRAIRPGARISAAVYAMPRRMRTTAICQEWETWVANGWVDTLNPMTYVQTAKELAINAGSVRESTADRALVYPGLSIRQLDTAGLIEQLDTSRECGTIGTTMFAAAHLDDNKVDVLKVGPYRRQPIMTPQSEPMRASRLLVDDFAAMVNRYLQDPSKHILSDQASTNDVLVQIDSIQRSMHGLSNKANAEQIDAVLKDVTNLHGTIKDWLRLEAFIQRGYRAQYIVAYLGQVEAILSYASHKARCEGAHAIAVGGGESPK